MNEVGDIYGSLAGVGGMYCLALAPLTVMVMVMVHTTFRFTAVSGMCRKGRAVGAKKRIHVAKIF